jgi:hypothetical protein
MHTLRAFTLLIALLACEQSVLAQTRGFVSGVWQKGHNITEPRPKSSKFVKTIDGGFFFVPAGAAYRVEIEVSPDLATPYFVQATLENPQDSKKPFIHERVVSTPEKQFTLAHGPVKGLHIYRDYRVEVKIFRAKGDAEPIDVLDQKVRSYVDTRGTGVKVMGGMKEQ